MSAITAKASRKMKKYAVLTREPRCFLGSFDFSWEQRKLGDVVKEITRNDPESEAPIMMITANNGFIEQSERYAFNNAGESLKKYILLKKGELAYNHGASKLRPYGSCFALTTAENARIPFVYHCFSAENQNAEFMSIELNGAEIENQLRKIVSSGARMDGLLNISFDEYTSVSVILPGTEEQDRIADFFRHLDNLITLHQRKCVFLFGFFQAFISMIFTASTFSWEQRKLTEFVEFFSGLTYTPNDVQENGTLVLRSSNVSNGEVVDADNIYVNPQVVNSENVKVGDIVVVVRNGSRSLIGKHAQIKAFMPNTVIGAFMTGIRSECPEFTNALLNTSRFEEEIAMNMGATINQITGYMFSKMEFKVPCLDEQKKIGEYFEKLDNLITLHQRECISFTARAGRLILTANKKRNTSSWEQRKLGDIADIVGGGTPSTGNQSYWDGDIDWYAPAEIADQIYANSSQKKITGLGYENSSAKMLPPGTVLFTSRAGIGKTAILTRKGCTNQGFQSIVPHRGELDSYFIFSRTEELKRYGELVGAGSPFVEVSGKQMAVMELMMPPTMREQQTIGGFFQQLDHLITLHQRQTIVYAVIRSIRKVILAERQYFAPPMVRKSP